MTAIATEIVIDNTVSQRERNINNYKTSNVDGEIGTGKQRIIGIFVHPFSRARPTIVRRRRLSSVN